MAIYKRAYRSYSGDLTAERWRFLVLTRYAWRGLFQSRILTAFFVVCFFYPVGALGALYLNSSAAVLSRLHVAVALFDVGGKFFFLFLSIQAALAFLLATFVGPGLVSPDLANGALPLYLCRPFSRAEYVLGKMSVLFLLLSLITWLPGLILFFVQSGLSGPAWMWNNLWIARALIFGSLIWIFLLSMLSLALSAWVKWRIAAAAMMLGIFFMGSGFGAALNGILRTKQGALFDITKLSAIIWADLFRLPNGISADFSPAEAWLALAVICVCCLGLLAKRLRAHEVVK